ncbi:MAG TPA: FAD-dependent monooxygenase [Pyrinomonadaceae bacterium]|nr:FAD-dependent monooxygenase [Pyrinomonadaceae bacterium]
MRIAIIGGGIGGLTAALALRRVGFSPIIFEQAPELLEVGAAIALWPNAMRLLRHLDLDKEIMAKAGIIENVKVLDWRGKLLKSARLPETNAPAVALRRADLQTTLLHAVPAGSVHLGHHLTGFLQNADKLTVTFSDGASFDCDLLIGADGLHSAVRAQAFNDGEPAGCGYIAWRGVSDFRPLSLTPGTAIEIHGLGKRFGIGPVGLGRVGWWATANFTQVDDETSDEQQRLLELFAGWFQPVIELIQETPEKGIVRNSVFDRPRASRWGMDRFTLLGDAIHPTTPNLGQGGCLAIEDAIVLARCLSKDNDPVRALRNYERLRDSRTANVVRWSRYYGVVGQWQSWPATFTRSLIISMCPESVIQRLLLLVFDYDANEVKV